MTVETYLTSDSFLKLRLFHLVSVSPEKIVQPFELLAKYFRNFINPIVSGAENNAVAVADCLMVDNIHRACVNTRAHPFERGSHMYLRLD